MGISFNQVAVGTAPTLLANLAGPFNLQLTLAGGTGSTIFLGTSTVTSTTGAYCVGGVAWQLAGYSTTKPTAVYGVTAGSTISCGIALSTAQ